MGVMDRIRRLSRDQQEALRAIDREEQKALELENLEADHIAAEEAYLRRRDRLLGREVADRYEEIDAARSLLAQAVRRRQERFESMRVAVLTGRAAEPDGPTQLALLPV
jgi:lipase chaperone LimK